MEDIFTNFPLSILPIKLKLFNCEENFVKILSKLILISLLIRLNKLLLFGPDIFFIKLVESYDLPLIMILSLYKMSKLLFSFFLLKVFTLILENFLIWFFVFISKFFKLIKFFPSL